jgi:predicted component of type VI protein secretion system
MSVLRNLEARIEGLVEGVFSRAFSSGVQPVEIARKLSKEMDAHRTASVSTVYVPNEYTVWLSSEDHERLKGYESSLSQELAAHLLEHARRHDYDLLTRPVVDLDVDDRLRLGEFGIQTRLVRAPRREGSKPTQGETGHTMIYSAAQVEKEKKKTTRDQLTGTKAVVTLDDRRFVLAGPTAVIGRSKEADCVIDDPNLSRKHAELIRGDDGDWSVTDLGSTNGIKVNDRRVPSARLTPGDEVTLGTLVFTFDIEQ